MKFSSQEEYGLRCILRIAGRETGNPLTISQISAAEGMSMPYVAKLLRILRQAGFVDSSRGQTGGYILARPAKKIIVADVLASLGGRLVEPGFCDQFRGLQQVCANSLDCSMRALWQAVQYAVEDVLGCVTLEDLLQPERDMELSLAKRLKEFTTS